MVKRIEKNGVLYALIIPGNFKSDEKYNFLTPSENYLQLGINFYSNDDHIKNHIHLHCSRDITRTEEVIVLQKGRMRSFIFDEEKNLLSEQIMVSGDIMYLARGGHGFELLEACQIFEVKQGPYLSKEVDKTLF